jgi:hypothetical protein
MKNAITEPKKVAFPRSYPNRRAARIIEFSPRAPEKQQQHETECARHEQQWPIGVHGDVLLEAVPTLIPSIAVTTLVAAGGGGGEIALMHPQRAHDLQLLLPAGEPHLRSLD